MKKDNTAFALVIFGATGNLSQIKLLPALYDLEEVGLLPERMTIVGIGRRPMTDTQFRRFTSEILELPNLHHQHAIKDDVEKKLLDRIHYIEGDIRSVDLYEKITTYLDHTAGCVNRIFYMATYPEFYANIFRHLDTSGLNNQDCGWVRIMVEKPIGNNLESSKHLNRLLATYYIEDQIYRLDHYLGKATLQNLLTFRFNNDIFEHLINKDHVDHIQITAAEDFGINFRGNYYDKVGALKDVGQNHILQMIALSTMEQPDEFTSPAVTQKRIDLIRSLVAEPDKIVFGQYEGYLKEKDVAADSRIETFFAFRTHISSSRFRGVPIYVRAGKKLSRTVTEISIVFKKQTLRLFSNMENSQSPNILIYRIQPNEGIVLRFLTKTPGDTMKLKNDYLQFCYRQSGKLLPDPYLRLILDVIKGDQTFFIDAPEVEDQWRFTDPYSNTKHTPIIYKQGSWGPAEADTLIESDGRSWIEPSVEFCPL